MANQGSKKLSTVELIPITGIGEIQKGENISDSLLDACRKLGFTFRSKDILVVTHKIVSKAEGRVLDLDDVLPSRFAIKAGKHIQKDPRQVEVILSEARRLVKMVRGLIIAETSHGFVCANAGVDQSNVDKGKIVLLPRQPDKSAQKLREGIKRHTRKEIAVIISDTFGRPWREGQVDVAIGLAGIDPFSDYRGRKDQYGYELHATVICIADEIASAAELCMKKLDRVPAVVVRGIDYVKKEGVSSRSLARKPARDLFR
jgi:coenzyme F420-0:L-glutamate ligase/coenzyme F420-1:gamma-L-glutamate ligase